jgi:hypothetical protein
MSEEKKDNTITGNTKIVSIISLILFIICMILLINFILPLCNISINIRDVSLRLISILLFFVFVPFLPIYILYLLFSTIFIYNKYKKIIYINIVSAVILSIFFTLYFTGFCFKEMRYWSKAEIIDKMLKSYIDGHCDRKYKLKNNNSTEIIKEECSISLESIKQEAPQCFTNRRKNSCKGTVTHFDKKTNSIIKSEIDIYRYGSYSHGSFGSYEYKRYYVNSDLNKYDRNDNSPIIGCCGTIKGPGMWD